MLELSLSISLSFLTAFNNSLGRDIYLFIYFVVLFSHFLPLYAPEEEIRISAFPTGSYCQALLNYIDDVASSQSLSDNDSQGNHEKGL